MNPWIELIGVIFLALVGAGVGVFFSRLRAPYWFIGYILPLVLVGMIGAAQHIACLNFIPPFSWLMSGQNEYMVFALSAMILTMPLAWRLSTRRASILLSIFTTMAVADYAVLPFVDPIIARRELSQIKTLVDSNKVCIQSTDYTCGPAAAVTALQYVGIKGDEGQIGLRAHTGFDCGTAPDMLASAVMALYGDQGVTCQYRSFRSISELNDLCPVIALVKFSFMIDHFVTVLDVTPTHVVVGDPLWGKLSLTHPEFEAKWRCLGIVVKRNKTTTTR